MAVQMGNHQTNTIFKETYIEEGYAHGCFTASDNLSLSNLIPNNNEVGGIVNKFLGSNKNEGCNISRIFNQLEAAKQNNEVLLTKINALENDAQDEIFEKQTKLLEFEANKYFISGLKFEDSNNLENAIESYEYAINLNANFYNAFLNLGRVKAKLASFKNNLEAKKTYFNSAIESFEKAIKLCPDNYTAFNCLAFTLEKLAVVNKNDEITLLQSAIENYEKAIEINDKVGTVFYNLANVLSKLAELKDNATAETLLKSAIKNYEKVIEIKPSCFEVFADWSICLSKLGDLKKGNEAQTYNNLAYEKLRISLELEMMIN